MGPVLFARRAAGPAEDTRSARSVRAVGKFALTPSTGSRRLHQAGRDVVG